MKKIVLSVLLAGSLVGGLLATPVYAQQPAPTDAKKAEMEEIVKKLNLSPRQKIQVGRILRDAKASGQDKMTTAEQIGPLLTDAQKQILKAELKAKAAGTP